MPSGWPSAIAPPFGLTCSASSASPSWRMQASACEAKASFSSITSKSPICRPEPLHQLARRGHRADAHDARRHAGRRHADDARARRQPVRFHGGLRRDDHRGRAVVHARRIAGRHGAGIAERRLELGEALERRLGARMLVRVDLHRHLAGDLHRHDLLGEVAGRDRLAGALLRAPREGILIGRASTWNSSATFSPVSGIASTPYCFFISGLMKRQPIVVS